MNIATSKKSVAKVSYRAKLEVETVLPVGEIPLGTFVKRIQICKTCNGDGATSTGLCSDCDTKGYKVQTKVYKRGQRMRASKRWGTRAGYMLEDTDDISREVFVFDKTRLLVGFTY